MLELALRLPFEGSEFVDRVRNEARLLSTRLTETEASDANTLRELRLSLADHRAATEDRLAKELEALQRVSAKRIVQLKERGSASALERSTSVKEVAPSQPVAATTGSASSKVVDFWRAKQEASALELQAAEAQLATLRAKISDIREGSTGAPAKLMCSIAALRERLQQAKERTAEYKRLLATCEQMDLPQIKNGELTETRSDSVPDGAAADATTRAARLHAAEVSVLCQLETSLRAEQATYEQFTALLEKRRDSLQSKVDFLNRHIEERTLTFVLPETPVTYDPIVPPEPLVTVEKLVQLQQQMRDIEASRTEQRREQRAAMMRATVRKGNNLDRWIQLQRHQHITRGFGQDIDDMNSEKASLLYKIEEIASNAKSQAKMVSSLDRSNTNAGLKVPTSVVAAKPAQNAPIASSKQLPSPISQWPAPPPSSKR